MTRTVAEPIIHDPWDAMRKATRARVGLGRSGNAQITADVLAFQAAHALARDAVHCTLDVAGLTQALAPETPLIVSSAAADRAGFLSRPDLGRQLEEGSRRHLSPGDWDVAFVLGDGLSAQAVMKHGPALFKACQSALAGWRIAPPIIARQCRVALGDDIAVALGARMVAVLIGERPGLTVSDSIGVYLTFAPHRGCPDSRRNCLSNIHAHGLSIDEASGKLLWLMREARRIGLTGVALKERAPETKPGLAQAHAPCLDLSEDNTP